MVHLMEADRLEAAKGFTGAITELEAGLALDTQSEDLQRKLRASGLAIEELLGSLRGQARAKLVMAERAIAFRQWESAIEQLETGLAVEGTHDVELTVSLAAALVLAEDSLAARDAAREEAEARLAEGDRLVAATDFRFAIAALQAGLALDSDSEDLRERLQTSLRAMFFGQGDSFGYCPTRRALCTSVRLVIA
jgi:hypothetical protein